VLYHSLYVCQIYCISLIVTLRSSWTGELFHISVQSRYLRRVWRYQRDNQHPYIEEEQTTQWPKEKVQKDKQRSTKHTYRTKDRAIRTPLKTVGRLRCSGRVSSFRSTRYTHDHRLHRTTYSQNAALSIMLPYSSGISKLTYTRTRFYLLWINNKSTRCGILQFLELKDHN
jgi:hypothetical protein